MKLRSIKRQGGRRPAIPESERKLTVLPAEPTMTADERRWLDEHYGEFADDLIVYGTEFVLKRRRVAEDDSH